MLQQKHSVWNQVVAVVANKLQYKKRMTQKVILFYKLLLFKKEDAFLASSLILFLKHIPICIKAVILPLVEEFCLLQ